ncbi:Conserved oligomeric Golgi complex component 6, partial [Aphelenchoides avenae]
MAAESTTGRMESNISVQRHSENPLKTRADKLMMSKLESNEAFAGNMSYLQGLVTDGNVTERQLRLVLEDRELEMNRQFLDNLDKINGQVQEFVEKIRKMNGICTDMTSRIQSNKERTRDLLKKTAVLQNEKKQLTAKQAYINTFLDKYSLNDEETRALEGSPKDNTVSEPFFAALRRLLEIHSNVAESLRMDGDNLPLVEISRSTDAKLDAAYQVLYLSIQRECRLLNVEFLELKPLLYQSFEALQERIPLFEKALEEFSNARRNYVVRAYIDALTKGGKTAVQRPIEQLSSEPLRYVNDMLAWIHQAIEVERELLSALLKNCKPEVTSTYQKQVICGISDALCQPLKLRVEQTLSRETNCVVLYRLSSLFLFYQRTFETTISVDSLLYKTLKELHELCSNMFFSAVNSTMQRITSHMNVPDYDLLPVNAVNQALLLLRDILESQNDGAFTAVSDKKEMYSKIFAYILDPLNQSVQLVCSNLHNHLDVAVYMLNCLNAIKSVIILYQYTDTKIEMIKAQIDANEDVLVSEQ